eukprot:7231296-Pyramimonas_sp.AAC.1
MPKVFFLWTLALGILSPMPLGPKGIGLMVPKSVFPWHRTPDAPSVYPLEERFWHLKSDVLAFKGIGPKTPK